MRHRRPKGPQLTLVQFLESYGTNAIPIGEMGFVHVPYPKLLPEGQKKEFNDAAFNLSDYGVVSFGSSEGLKLMPKRKAKSNPSHKRRGKKAGEFVREEMHALRRGSKHVHSIRQAVAAGLNRARSAGIRVPLPNPSGMFNVGVTYDVVTPESAEVGDFDETGWELEPEDMTLRGAVSEIRKYEPYDGVQPSHDGMTLYQADSDINYRTGAETRHAVHVKASPHNISRLLKALGYRVPRSR